MYKSAFIYIDYMHRWFGYSYISVPTIGCYLCTTLLVGYISLMICIYVGPI